MSDFEKEIIKSMPREQRCFKFICELMKIIEFNGLLSDADKEMTVDMLTKLKGMIGGNHGN